DRPSRLDSNREVGVAFGTQAGDIDGAAAAAERHFAIEWREPPVAHGAGDLRLAPVDGGPDPFERPGVSIQRDGARQIAHDDSREIGSSARLSVTVPRTSSKAGRSGWSSMARST